MWEVIGKELEILLLKLSHFLESSQSSEKDRYTDCNIIQDGIIEICAMGYGNLT